MQAAINAASNLLPRTLPAPPTYSKSNPADTPILTLARQLGRRCRCAQVDDYADSILAQKISQVSGVGLVTHRTAARSRRCACRSIRSALAGAGLALEDVRAGARGGQRQPAEGQPRRAAPGLHARRPTTSSTSADGVRAADHRLPERRAGAARRDVANVVDGVENAQLAGWAERAARRSS